MFDHPHGKETFPDVRLSTPELWSALGSGGLSFQFNLLLFFVGFFAVDFSPFCVALP